MSYVGVDEASYRLFVLLMRPTNKKREYDNHRMLSSSNRCDCDDLHVQILRETAALMEGAGEGCR